MNDDGIGVVAFVDNTASASSIDNDNNHWLTFLLKVIVNVPLLTKEVITSIKGPLGSYQRGYQSASLRQNITQPGVTCYAMSVVFFGRWSEHQMKLKVDSHHVPVIKASDRTQYTVHSWRWCRMHS
ncbi:hypothetical protein J6590_041036 [Homalodisca vitripennis]|nr:hypothetical protein J6590_041036 [Homalodisca vitripennis]